MGWWITEENLFGKKAPLVGVAASIVDSVAKGLKGLETLLKPLKLVTLLKPLNKVR